MIVYPVLQYVDLDDDDMHGAPVYCEPCGKRRAVTQVHAIWTDADFVTVLSCDGCLQWLVERLEADGMEVGEVRDWERDAPDHWTADDGGVLW